MKPHGALSTKRDNRITDHPATREQLVALIDERAPEVQYTRTYRKKEK